MSAPRRPRTRREPRPARRAQLAASGPAGSFWARMARRAGCAWYRRRRSESRSAWRVACSASSAVTLFWSGFCLARSRRILTATVRRSFAIVRSRSRSSAVRPFTTAAPSVPSSSASACSRPRSAHWNASARLPWLASRSTMARKGARRLSKNDSAAGPGGTLANAATASSMRCGRRRGVPPSGVPGQQRGGRTPRSSKWSMGAAVSAALAAEASAASSFSCSNSSWLRSARTVDAAF